MSLNIYTITNIYKVCLYLATISWSFDVRKRPELLVYPFMHPFVFFGQNPALLIFDLFPSKASQLKAEDLQWRPNNFLHNV